MKFQWYCQTMCPNQRNANLSVCVFDLGKNKYAYEFTLHFVQIVKISGDKNLCYIFTLKCNLQGMLKEKQEMFERKLMNVKTNLSLVECKSI